MDQAFIKLKSGRGVCWKTKNGDQAEAWRKAFYARAELYGPWLIIKINRSQGYHYMEVSRQIIEPLYKRPAITQEQAEENYSIICEGSPETKRFIKELYEAGLIPGIRSIYSATRCNESTEKDECEPVMAQK